MSANDEMDYREAMGIGKQIIDRYREAFDKLAKIPAGFSEVLWCRKCGNEFPVELEEAPSDGDIVQCRYCPAELEFWGQSEAD